MNLLLVMLGGAIGTGGRYLLGGWVNAQAASGFPWGTLANLAMMSGTRGGTRAGHRNRSVASFLARCEDGCRTGCSPYLDTYNDDRNPYGGAAARRSSMQKVHEYPESARQPEDVTTGTVWTETLAETTTPPMLVNRAHFSPGARTCWHEHARGQVLVIENGVALVGFGADSGIEVISAVALLWRLLKAGSRASAEETGAAEERALYLVAATFFLPSAYIAYEAVGALLAREAPDGSTVGLVLAAISLLVMPTLAHLKGRTGREMGSEALRADAKETWVCSYLSLALLAGVGLYALFGWWWADPVGALAMLPVILWQGFETLGEAREKGGDGD